MSINGLTNIAATSIQNSGEFYLGSNLDPGTAGDTIVSQGANLPVSWGTHTGTINALTAGTNITYTSGNPTFNGSVADTINATDTDTTYSAGNGIDLTGTTFSTDNDGTTINNSGAGNTNQVLKVPQSITINATPFDGSVARNFTLSTTDTTYSDGDNLNLVGTTFNLDTSITDMRGITYESGYFATTLTGNDYPGSLTTCTYLDLTSSTNIIHPPNVFLSGSDLRMSINLGDFMPNDDSTYYNIGVEDDGSSAIHGTVRPLASTMEVCGYVVIPRDYTATDIRIDINDAAGNAVSRIITVESVITYGGTGFTALGSITSNSEQSITNFTGITDRNMLIRIITTATTDHIRGGYIKLSL